MSNRWTNALGFRWHARSQSGAATIHRERTELAGRRQSPSEAVRPPVWPLATLIVVAGTIAYANSFHGSFMLDDHRYIERNPRIESLLSIGRILSHRRPVLDFTLAVNYTFGGLHVAGYHALNLLIHQLAALTLFGLVRRSLGQMDANARLGRAVPGLAAAVAILWATHPVQTQSVTYLIQRSESLMGLFYLLMLYAVVRAERSHRPRSWFIVALAAGAMGMGTKGVMVTAPLVCALYDYTFLSRSVRRMIRQRRWFYAGLFTTPAILWLCGVAPAVLSTSKPVATVGFSFQDVSPMAYLLTQPGVMLHYLRLAVWPHPLCLDYDWPIATTYAAVAPQAAIILSLIAATIYAWRRIPPVGFAGVCFFLILVPTSSVIPIKDPLFEHRMYLPLASILTLLVLGGYEITTSLVRRDLWERRVAVPIRGVAVGAAAFVLTAGTVARNRVYADGLTMWQDVVAKRPRNHRAHYNLGRMLLDIGRLDRAAASFRNALELHPPFAEARYNLGKIFARQGDRGRAAEAYAKALAINPDMAEALSDLGNHLARQGLTEQAIAYYRRAIRADRRYAPAHFNLGKVLLTVGRVDDAVQALQKAVRFSPHTAHTRFALADALRQKGLIDEAVREYQRILEIDPGHRGAREALRDLRRSVPHPSP